MSRSAKTWSPSKENLLLQHLAQLERSPSIEDSAKFGSQCSINLDDNFLDLPTEAKRRRIEDTQSALGSQVSSLVSSRSHSPSMSECFLDDSLMSTPSASPTGTLKEHFRRKYRKDELWASIEHNYKYLMDKGIIEACQTTESEGEENPMNSTVSFGEFLTQYKEVSDWLNTIQAATQHKRSSTLPLSEKYLNQSYHDEIERSQRLTSLRDYARQLKQRQPVLWDEVDVFMKEITAQWDTVQTAVAPTNANQDPQSMLRDLEDDLEFLRRWLDGVEDHLRVQAASDWQYEALEGILKEHKFLQQDIESHSRIVSAVRKLSERLKTSHDGQYPGLEQDNVGISAQHLERRWHEIWLQSLEWQCRLEDAITRRKGIFNSTPYLDPSNFCNLRDYTDDEYDTHDVTSSGDDSFNGFVYRRDFIQTPSTSDNSALLSPEFDKSSSKDSAVSSETEQKTFSDMSENYQDLSVSASSDSDREFLRQIKIKKHDSRDIGYGSESQSDEVDGRYRGITFSGISGKARKSNKTGDFYATVAIDTGSGSSDKTDGGTSNHAEQTTCDESDINVQISAEQVLMQEESEMEDIRYLIDQADIMVQQGNTFNKTFSPKHQAEPQNGQSLTTEQNTDSGSKSSSSASSSMVNREMVDKGVGTIESSCDASDEESGSSDVPVEDHSMDDGTETLDSVLGSEYTSDEMRNGCRDYSKLPKLYDTNSLRSRFKGRNKERPLSVVELPNVTELKLSNSESAIDKLGAHSDSDIPSASCTMSQSMSPTFPRHRMRRAQCVTRDGVTHTSSHRSQLGAKRKLNLDTSLNSSQTPISGTDITPTNIVNSVHTENIINDSSLDITFTSNSDNNVLHSETVTPSGQPPLVPLGESCTSEDEVMTPMPPLGNDLIQTLQSARFKSSGSSDSDTQGDLAAPSEPDDPNNDGSFSENAWDNYQAPLYPTGSEDPPEEALTWEPGEMEFDDEFSLPQSTILATLIARRSEEESLTNKHPKLMPSNQCVYEDSDSDIEDLHHVLEESRMQLKVADRSLRKKRKDPLKTGLYLNPGKYGELLATIDTNIRCLEAINQHLDPADVSQDDIQTIQDLLYQWEKLQALASDRRNQSQEVKTMYATYLSVEGSVIEGIPQLDRTRFTSIDDLKDTLTHIVEKQKYLQCQREMLSDLRGAIATFSTHNASVNMENFLSQIQDTEDKLDALKHRCMSRLCELEHIQCVWLEYRDIRRELEFLLTQERQLLERLAFSHEMDVGGNKESVEEDLKKLVNNLGVYEEKLSALQRLRGELMEISDDDTQLDITAGLADIRNQIYVAQKQCRDMMSRDLGHTGVQGQMDITETECLEERMEVEEEVQKLDITPILSKNVSSVPEVSKPIAKTPAKVRVPTKQKSGGLPGWLTSFPFQAIALVVLLGLMYLAAPESLRRLLDFTLRLTPELKYVNGAPPV